MGGEYPDSFGLVTGFQGLLVAAGIKLQLLPVALAMADVQAAVGVHPQQVGRHAGVRQFIPECGEQGLDVLQVQVVALGQGLEFFYQGGVYGAGELGLVVAPGGQP